MMKIAVLGTGMVGQALAGRLHELGHDVTVGTRDVAASLARMGQTPMGAPEFGSWYADHSEVAVATMPDAVADAELVVLATAGVASHAALELAGAASLSGTTILDISNPLDFSNGMPPSLAIVNTDSLGEHLQHAFPDAHVVKALNTVNANVMVHPAQLAGGDHTIFMAGNDEGAKQQVRELLESFGWRDILDLGDISAARGTEMYLPLWLRLFGTLQTPAFSIKVVR